MASRFTLTALATVVAAVSLFAAEGALACTAAQAATVNADTITRASASTSPAMTGAPQAYLQGMLDEPAAYETAGLTRSSMAMEPAAPAPAFQAPSEGGNLSFSGQGRRPMAPLTQP